MILSNMFIFLDGTTIWIPSAREINSTVRFAFEGIPVCTWTLGVIHVNIQRST